LLIEFNLLEWAYLSMRLDMSKILLVVFSLILSACVGMPENVQPVEHFELDRYLGKWYEIARMDHAFEQGLSQVTAEYSMRDDGGIKVVNRGYLEVEKKWKQSVGKAYFVSAKDIGLLKVSFFGPFYGSYIVFELDHDHYQYAVISGPDKSYMWILARAPTISKNIQDALLAKAAALGFDTGKLIFVKQDVVSKAVVQQKKNDGSTFSLKTSH
jgi:apolipoprotein D and lipocalin family protein